MPVFVSREAEAIAEVERREASASKDARPRKRHLDAPSGAPLPSRYVREGKQHDGVPGAANNTGGEALA